MPDVVGQFLSLGQADIIALYWKPASITQLTSLGTQYGWPLYGIFIAGGGRLATPDFILERHSFPTPGAGGDPANRLQTAIDSLMADAFKSLVDPKDSYVKFAVCHIWNVQQDKGLYLPRENGAGDYNLYLSNATPPANWWQGM